MGSHNQASPSLGLQSVTELSPLPTRLLILALLIWILTVYQELFLLLVSRLVSTLA